MFATLELPVRDDCRHKRLKVGRACHPCRMKKIKCDGKQPCMQCKARQRQCVYSKNTDETYIKLDPVEESSDACLQEVAERAQEQQRRYATTSFMPTTTTSTSTPTTMPDQTLMNEDTALFASSTSSNGIRHGSEQPPAANTRPDKMIEQLTEELVNLTLQSEGGGSSTAATTTSQKGDGSDINGTSTVVKSDQVTPWQHYGSLVRWSPEPSLPSSYCIAIDMPTRDIQERLLHIFFTHCHPAILPTFSRRMFFDQLQVKGPLITPLLLNVMYAYAAKHLSDTSTTIAHSHLQADAFFSRARQLVDDFLDVPRVSTVIALLYMTTFEGTSGTRWSHTRAWMYCGMAVRMCLDLGLHTTHYSSQMSLFDIELRKRVLWTCYVMDKWASGMAERPWMLRAQDLVLEFPAPMPEDDPQEVTVLNSFIALCRLSMLTEKVAEFFSDTARHSEWTMQDEAEILHFLGELDRWREDTQSSSSSPFLSLVHLLGYDLELSLVLCCRYQPAFTERRRSLAHTVTQLVSLILQQQPKMSTLVPFSLLAFSALFAALAHATDPALRVASDIQFQFQSCLHHVRRLLANSTTSTNGHDSYSGTNIRNDLVRLIDITLRTPTSNIGSTSNTTTSSHATTTIASLLTSSSPSLSPVPQAASTSSSFESSRAARAAAAAIGAVGTPAFGSYRMMDEPADYTFELISVADEWARSVVYPPTTSSSSHHHHQQQQ
ncbi:hypothetical protein RO3G_11822 [Lichtheimia corymbifera JMRC:FSU:9682]|uniref:Zn(2)-C6 fungal-type domain-containing protein n=1 Tax=Lichtheimia corymbifera JMRC:FSU:9682 TaxID=1263082 RepID=A0A068RRQ9_9FUNG|nr:hypothetical protein RO3G_11822 [Lichtheimia corymbifera JMRC:FSU:9682]